MGVSKNSGTPKWMVYNGKTLLKIDDLGGFPIFLDGNIHIVYTPPKTQKGRTFNKKYI